MSGIEVICFIFHLKTTWDGQFFKMATRKQSPLGTLFVVATPVGNLEDITSRAVRTMQEVDLIACEDTRRTGKLLSHLQISTPLISYYREKEQEKALLIVNKLIAGSNIALLSDAGTPGICDPGAVLVRLARDNSVAVVPVPGVSALASALSVAGLPQAEFYFGGFPPSKSSLRRKFFRKLVSLSCPLVFYESPHRIEQSLYDCFLEFGDRKGLLFRELTKMYEEVREGTISELYKTCSGKNRGEMVLILHGNKEQGIDKPEDIDQLIFWYRDKQHASLKTAVAGIAEDLQIPRSKVYQRALEVWKNDDGDK